MIPNHEGIYDGGLICIPSTKIKINSNGLRDYEYSIKKPNNTFRIIVLGDSHAMGMGVELNETYPRVLERMLNPNHRKYEVLNFGVHGYNLIQKIELLKIKGLTYEPDMILFQYSGDDTIDRNVLDNLTVKSFNDFAKKNNISTNVIDEFTKAKIGSAVLRMLLDVKEKNPSKTSELIANSFDNLSKIIEKKT
ncbi:MAG: hypothetical protein QMD36_04220 [Candidatus Aenigmarchaeota archaeon]|nr:hypothetical protein [Candidatus Aenigmarchaeota archaeon]